MTSSFAEPPESAIVQLAASAENGSRRSIPCTFYGMESKRLIIELGEPLPISTVLSVEHEDVLFLGEVLVCRATSGPSWSIEVKVDQVLTGLQSLMNLRARLLGEGVPQSLFVAKRVDALN